MATVSALGTGTCASVMNSAPSTPASRAAARSSDAASWRAVSGGTMVPAVLNAPQHLALHALPLRARQAEQHELHVLQAAVDGVQHDAQQRVGARQLDRAEGAGDQRLGDGVPAAAQHEHHHALETHVAAQVAHQVGGATYT